MMWLLPRLLLVALLGYVVIGAILYFVQHRLLYFPGAGTFGSCPALAQAEHINRDGVRAYLLPNDSTRIVVLYHGNAGTACDRAHYAEMFARAGFATLIIEYPGYGGDTDHPTTKRMLAAVDRVVALLPSLGYPDVVIAGESIGTGFASYHASRAPVQGLVLITPYDRLSAVVQDAVRWYPARLLLRTDLRVDAWSVAAPRILLIDAEQDEVVHRARTDSLARTLGNRATRVTIADATHNSVSTNPSFASAIEEFLASTTVAE